MSGEGLDLAGLLDADDFEQLLASGQATRDDADDAGSELRRLSRRLSGQVVDQLARFAADAFGRDRARHPSELDPALQALRRLAVASSDPELQASIDALRSLLASAEGRGRVSRVRRMARLRNWIRSFAELLDGDDAERVRRLVTFDAGTLPLLEALRNVDGIGPRRLEQLYCAGLYRVDVVSRARPEEISAVTGLTVPLAVRVVVAAQRFADERRRRCARELVRTAVELREVTGVVGGADQDVLEAARTACRELQELLAEHREEDG